MIRPFRAVRPRRPDRSRDERHMTSDRILARERQDSQAIVRCSVSFRDRADLAGLERLCRLAVLVRRCDSASARLRRTTPTHRVRRNPVADVLVRDRRSPSGHGRWKSEQRERDPDGHRPGPGACRRLVRRSTVTPSLGDRERRCDVGGHRGSRCVESTRATTPVSADCDRRLHPGLLRRYPADLAPPGGRCCSTTTTFEA